MQLALAVLIALVAVTLLVRRVEPRFAFFPFGGEHETPFPDARSAVRSSPVLLFLSLFSSYRFSTATLMERVKAPALELHGDRDSVIPIALGRELFARLEEPKRFVSISGGDHNDAVPADPETYWSAVDAFIETLPKRRD